MTGCWRGCWIGVQDGLRSLRRTVYLTGRSTKRARYNDLDSKIEFENLIEDEDFQPASRRILTDNEKELINQRKYDLLVEHQRRIDFEIDAQLRKEEDDLRLEEEAYYEARREAARAAKQTKDREEKKVLQNHRHKNSKQSDSVSVSSWFSDDDLSLDSADLDAEDFDSFLEKVKARSLPSNEQGGSATILSNGVENGSWETSLEQSVEATKIAGKSLDAFKVLDLCYTTESDDRATDVER